MGQVLPPKETSVFMQGVAGLSSWDLPFSLMFSNLITLATACVFLQLVYKYTMTSVQALFSSRDLNSLKKMLFFASGT